ncbi:LCP family protein [uncultured Ruminococcus sp.]|uniref:LCP family protein n=1 Tax=uncultured Ruminococcus sp. TaxID=165186 RepID=UPI0025CBC11F|nr:LCP family protein [uncultured Ruminococcus sp.]
MNKKNYGANPRQEYPGQPYYDENGVLHRPMQSDSGGYADQYEQEYQRQLEEYNRLMGGTDNDIDLQFHSMNENTESQYLGKREYVHPQRQASSSGQTRRSGQSGQSRSRTSGTSEKYRPENLKFGSNTPKKNSSDKSGSSKNTNRSKNTKAKEKPKKVKNSEKKSRNPHPIRTFFKVLFVLIIVLFLLLNLLLLRYIGMVNIKESGERTVTNASMNDSNVTNILLIGSDTREENVNGRTDSMIMLSVNRTTKEITMTSFMRDMYVEIVGKNSSGESVDFWDKMNAAYVYGGAELLMDTIEYNFDIQVDNYVYVDFYSFVDIVDAIGGIEIEVTDEEAEGMRAPIGEQNKILGNEKGTDYLSGGGKILMNGNQALAYSRLRYVGNSDFERTERQREVITKIIDKVKTSDPLTIDKFMRSACSDLTTNMSKAEMLKMTYKGIFSLGYEMKSLRIPDDDSYTYGTHNEQSTLDVDFDRYRQLLRDEIYG